MCGIAGAISYGAERISFEDLRSMCAAMAHRGPDDEGFRLEHGVGLGMRRLKVIDLETGQQPIANEDGSVWAVLNGEIYNYRELRNSLRAHGHHFRTATDTEVIVHLYEEEGESFVRRLRGMFALAVWDSRSRTLLLARDRFGIKPLYYCEAGGKFYFASELKALLQIDEIPRSINLTSLNHLLTWLTTPHAESIVTGIHKLEPASTLVTAAGPCVRPGVRIERYWQPRFAPEQGRSIEEWEERLRQLLEESVRMHLISDVPVGAFLSGGIDSSTVVAMMARLSSRPVKTFSIGFDEPGFDERPQARLVAEALGTEHHELMIEPGSPDVIEELAWYLDEPFGDSSAIPTYLVSKLAAAEVTVALSGDGGDELFGGYDRYVVESRERWLRFVPGPARRLLGAVSARLPEGAKGKRLLRHASLPDDERYLDASTLFTIEDKRKLLRPELFASAGGDRFWRGPGTLQTNGNWLSSLQLLDMERYLPLDVLAKVDRMSMAHSLETRVPLLDHPLVEFAATIPPDLLLHKGSTKYLFKRAMRGILPESILTQPKRGFAIPLGRWFKGELGVFARDLLLSKGSHTRGFFQAGQVERVLESCRPGELGLQAWTLLSFELWCRTFLDAGHRKVRPAPPSRQALLQASGQA